MNDFNEYFVDFENNFDELYKRALNFQKEFLDYVLSVPLGHKNVLGIILIISELYENKKTSFSDIYWWVLDRMFCEKFYDYSICYQFVDCLLMIESRSCKVFMDIVNKMDVNNSKPIQIAITGMYLHDDLFKKYSKIGLCFLEKELIGKNKIQIYVEGCANIPFIVNN